MPRNGSGVYSFPAGTEAITDTTIESAKYNAFVADVQQDLNTPRPIVAGGTGAASASAALIALSGEKAGQVVTNYDSFAFVSGSFTSVAAATSAPTVNAFAGIAYITDANNQVIEARDATTRIKYVRSKAAGVWGAWTAELNFSLVQQVFTASGTYTPTTGMVYCIIECVGGGGAGGGVVGNATYYLAGAGGGSGSYSRKNASAASVGASQVVTIGSGGTAPSGTVGGAGGDTSVGSLCIGKGGSGGGVSDTGQTGTGGAGGVAGTGDLTVVGSAGGTGFYNSNSAQNVQCNPGSGGASYFGGAGQATFAVGGNGTSGGGGGGGYVGASATNRAGGIGGNGLVIVTEYVLT